MAKRKAKNSKRRRLSRSDKLRADFENQILAQMLDRVNADEAKTDELAKLMHAYCELRKQDIAAGMGERVDNPEVIAPAAHSVDELKRLVNAVYGLTLRETQQG